MSKRLAAIATLAAAAAAGAGLFANPSNSAANDATGGYCLAPWCIVSLTAAGPSPSTVTMHAGDNLNFANNDSVAHTVVFTNGLCSLTVTPGEQEGGAPWVHCKDNFTLYVGSYAYTVDGNFPGTAVTTPLRRVVTLTARTHSIRRGTRLTLHGQVSVHCRQPCFAPSERHYVSVIVLARNNSKHPFQPVATVNPRFLAKVPGRWTLTVQPGETTTYITKVTGQLPQGRIWTSARSRPFTVRIRQ
jgi:plastocyanin